MQPLPVKLYLLQNEPIRLGPTEFACPFCGKVMKSKRDTQRHIRTHTGFKPYVCKICNCAFNDGSNLNRHITMHTGETPFTCNFCDYSANRKDKLSRHVQTKHPENFLQF
jgi:KRAB domain-containing zinc finger protein